MKKLRKIYGHHYAATIQMYTGTKRWIKHWNTLLSGSSQKKGGGGRERREYRSTESVEWMIGHGKDW